MTRIQPNLSRSVFATCLVPLALLMGAHADAQSGASPKPMTRTERNDARQTAPLTAFHLKYATQPNNGNEILTGLRLMADPSVKLYLIPSDNVILMRGLDEDVSLARQLIAELDRPRKSYRLSLTVTEVNGAEHGAPQHVTLSVASSQRVTFKQGSKVPVKTGSTDSGSIHQTQMTYLDIGLNLDMTFVETLGGGQLRYTVEESSVSPDVSPVVASDPVVRQTVLEGVTMMVLGKPDLLGAINLPAGPRHLEISATVEPE